MKTLEIKLENMDYQTASPIHRTYNSEDNKRGEMFLKNMIKNFDNMTLFSSSQDLKPVDFGVYNKFRIERYTIDNGIVIISKMIVDKPKFPGTIKGLHIIISTPDNDKIEYFQKQFDTLVKSCDQENNMHYNKKLLHS